MSVSLLHPQKRIPCRKIFLTNAVAALVLSTALTAQASIFQWLTASEVATVQTDAANKVISWQDFSAQGNHSTPLTGSAVGTPLFPSTSLSGSGRAGVDVGSSSWLGTSSTDRSGMVLLSVAKQAELLDFRADVGAARANTGFSVLVAFKANSVLTDAADNVVLVNHGNATFLETFGLRFDPTGIMESFIGGTVYKKTSGLKVSAGDTVVYAFSYDRASGAIQFWDSKNNSSLTATSTPSGDFVKDQTLNLGVSGNNGQQFNGMVGEVKIYSSKLTSTELVTEGQALATKWGASQPPNPTLDSDSDGVTDVDEATYGTNPNNPDTDGDGAGDYYEIFASFTSPTNSAIKPSVPYPLPKPDNSTGAANKPVKVFILAGQSNMVGMGDMNPITANGTLSKIVKTENKFPNLLDTSGNWSVRKDVQYRGVISAIAKANLTVGQGSSTSTIGPELGMGHVMGYHLDEPVLIIKAAQGNRSLLWDFLPPGSPRSTAGSTTYAGYGDSTPSWTGNPPGVPGAGQSYAGWQYDQSFLAFSDWYPPGSTADVENVADVLDNWNTQYPQWAAQGFEIAGFAWFQGWNDGLSYTNQAADRYEVNLVQMIKQLRSYYEGRYPAKIQPKAPFVVATCGFNGFAATGNRLKVANAQLAVGNPTKYPEFAGNVKSMETRGYWRTREQSNSKQDYHYWRNAETFMLVGDALGRGMIDLLGANTPQPNVWSQTAGGAQNWTAATNWDDGVVPNPTNTTTMDFSSANLLADTTLNLGADRTAQVWKFGDASGTQNWLVNSGNTMTLAGTTPTIQVNNNTTQLNNPVAGSAGLTKTGAGILNLSGTNPYTGGTSLSAGTLQFAKTAAMPAAGTVAVGTGSTLAVNVGGTDEWTTATTGTGSIGGLLAGTGGQGAPVTYAGTATVGFDTSNASGTPTYSGVIAIVGTTLGVTKLGAGTLALTAANTYTGATSVSGGTLQLSGSGRLGSGNYAGAVSIASGATLDYAASGTQTLGGAITGGGTLKNSGGGGLALTNAGNSYGALSVGSARVFINSSAGALPAAASVTVTNGNLVFGAGATRANAISVSSGGTLTARGATTLSNVTLPGSGSVIFNNDDANTNLLTINNGQTLTGTLTVQIGGSRMTTSTSALGGVILSGKLTGNGSLIVTSGGNSANTNGLFASGVLTLTGPNDYSGSTTVTSGTLAFGTSNVLPATAVSIGNGKLDAATFTDTAGTLNVTGNATINLGTGATLAFATGSPAWAGTLTLTGTFVSGSSLRFGTTSGGLMSTQLGKISADGYTNFGLTSTGYLTANIVGPAYNITNTTTDANGICTPVGVTSVASGGSQTYTLTPNAGYAVATLTVNGSPVTPALSYTFNNVSADQTISATFVPADTLHWDSNSSTPGFGNTTGTWGSSQFWTIDATGSSAPLPLITATDTSVNFGSATLNYNNAAVSVAAGGVNAGNLTFGAGQSTALTFSGGNITLGDTAVITVNNTANTIASVLAGAATSLTKAGTGILTLSAANLHTGTTAVAAGTLRLGANNVLPDGPGAGDVSVTGTLDLNTFSETLNGLTGAGTVDTLAGGTPTLTLGGADTTSTFDGTITDTSGTMTLEKTGSGTLILSGANGYSGPTTLTGGTLQIGNGGTTGSIDSTTGVTNDAALIFNRSDNHTVAYDIGGSGTLTKQGAGVLTLSGDNGYTGETSISAGTLKLATTTAVQNSSLVAVSANTLQIATSTGIASSGNLSINGGTIALNQPGPAPGLTHAFEQLAFTHNTQNFTSSNVTDGNATLTFTNGIVVSGSGGTATLNPTGVNLIIGSFEGGNTGTSTLNLGGTTLLNRIDGAIENGARTSQSIFKSNTGTWTLSGDNTYTGTTTIEQGTLKVGATEAIPSGAGKGDVVFNAAANTAILDLNGNDVTINGLTQATTSTTNRVVNHAVATLATFTVGGNDTSSTFAGILADHTGTGGTLALAKTGSGTLTLSGANTYTGDTTVNAGTLVLADNAQLKFVIDATSETNNRIINAGTVTLNGDFSIDTTLADASTLTSGSWTLVDAATLTGIFGASFTITGPEWSETSNVWTKTVGSKNYTFTESTGVLVLSPTISYATWADTNAPSTTPAQDQDNDGVSNAVEYILGGDASTNDLSKLPTISAAGENILFSFKRIQTSINASTALSIRVGTNLLTWPGSHIVGEDTATSSAGVTVQKGVPAGFDTVTLGIPRAPDLQKYLRLHVTVTP